MEYMLNASVPDETLPATAEALWTFDEEPGLRRQRRGRGFTYLGLDGSTVDDCARRRIDALAIPPAWTDVWICKDPKGHIQATGRDAKGRKQYIYHSRFREWRERQKFERTGFWCSLT